MTDVGRKKLRNKSNKVAREFCLKNLKRVAEKNQILCKIAKKNMIQACILSIACILFGIIFILMNTSSRVTKIVENSVTGFAALIGLLSSLRTFMSPSTAEEDGTAIKFSEIKNEAVELSLKNTDEDDMRNAEKTIEHWCRFLHVIKSSYTVFIMFSSFLLIIFTILDLTLDNNTSLVQVNFALIILGVISLFSALLNLHLLKWFTFSGNGEKDIERLINGVDIHFERDRSRELSELVDQLAEVPEVSNVVSDTRGFGKQELTDKQKIKCLSSNTRPEIASFIRKLWDLNGGFESSTENTDSEPPTPKEKLEQLVKLNILNCESAIGKYVYDLLEEFNQKEEVTADSQPKPLKKLIMKLSLKELVEISEGMFDSKSRFRHIKATVNSHILNELEELSTRNEKDADPAWEEFNKIEEEIKEILPNEKGAREELDNIEKVLFYVKDEYIFFHLYDIILDTIEIAEDKTKFKAKSCYIDLGKHFGKYLYRHLIPNTKKRKIAKSCRNANRDFICCYYRLGQLLFSDNGGENAPNRVTDLQIRKAQNIYNLFNNLEQGGEKIPINKINPIKTRHAATIFALSAKDVGYVIVEINYTISDKNDDHDKNGHDKNGDPEIVIIGRN